MRTTRGRLRRPFSSPPFRSGAKSRASLRANRRAATMQGCGVTLRVKRCRLDWMASDPRCSRSRSTPTLNRAAVAVPG
ncbi:hypothetical protein L842_2431 [Mycobacterium intracellulare MIN_052511_1280]|nr:hypothetical protein L842_2431 [Mycobacterium intracellulare MIN_052511_1280]